MIGTCLWGEKKGIKCDGILIQQHLPHSWIPTTDQKRIKTKVELDLVAAAVAARNRSTRPRQSHLKTLR